MSRVFVPFDAGVIDAELEALRASSSVDAAKLEFCIQRFEEVSRKENPSPAMVRTFAQGFKELRHEKGVYKGRMLFYEPKIPKETEEMVMLVVFRKETQKTPRAELNAAERRMALDLRRRADQQEKKQ